MDLHVFARRALREAALSAGTALWFMFLTFPIMVMKISPLDKTIQWRLNRMVWVGVSTFVLSLVWRYLMARRDRGGLPRGGAELAEEDRRAHPV